MSEAVVLGRGQLYRPEATPRAFTADRGPIRLYEDIIQALYENTHFMTPLWTNDLKLQFFFLFFRCGHNYTADQDLIWLHVDLIQVLLILTGPYITYWQIKKSSTFILHVFKYYYLNIKILNFKYFFFFFLF
jgi:hypothetical protein